VQVTLEQTQTTGLYRDLEPFFTAIAIEQCEIPLQCRTGHGPGTYTNDPVSDTSK
jgi:hypothetical protein